LPLPEQVHKGLGLVAEQLQLEPVPVSFSLLVQLIERASSISPIRTSEYSLKALRISSEHWDWADTMPGRASNPNTADIKVILQKFFTFINISIFF
jgi:hypothetical protein